MKFIPMMGLSGPTFTQPTLRPFQSASPSREVIVAFLGQREFVFAALIFRKCQRAFFADTSAFETLSHHFASIKLLQVVRQLARNCRKQAITQLDRCSMSVTAILHQLNDGVRDADLTSAISQKPVFGNLDFRLRAHYGLFGRI